jgi:3-oxoacyl-[acyl-carrier-protein] synthase II
MAIIRRPRTPRVRGTPKNDSAESNAVRAAFGAAAEKVALSSTKSMIGHLLGAAGAVEVIVTIRALAEQLAPPTAGFTAFDAKCGLDAVPGTARPMTMDIALSNNFAFAGANATIALARPGYGRAGSLAPPAPERVVITGLGVYLGPARTAADAWRNYCAGTSSRSARDGLRFSMVESDLAHCAAPRERRRMDRLSRLALASCRDALEEAGLAGHERVGVVLGTGLGPMRSTLDFFLPTINGGPSLGNPAIFPNTVHSAAAGQVAMMLGARGPTSTATAMHAAGASALCIAYDLLRAGRADAILCPAVDELPPGVLDAYRALGLFSGPAASRYTLAEGGVTVLLERESAARARGARILGELAGHAAASDAIGIGRWDPLGGGVERAMRGALAEAGADAGELTAIWSNAAGLAVVDRPEERAIGRLSVPASCKIETPKRVLGEPVGAGAQLSVVLAVTGWTHGQPAGAALINSSSLGGTHFSLVLYPAGDQ